MSVYYLDASALVKRYTQEPGSSWVRQITDAEIDNIILLSEITLVEVSAALAAKHRAPDGITEEQMNQALALFRHECDQLFLLLIVDRLVIDRAVVLTQKYRLRGYDAVQLATALVNKEVLAEENLPDPCFVASDSDLIKAANLEELSDGFRNYWFCRIGR